MIEANLKDHILSVKLRLIAKVNRQFLKEWQYELDHNRIFPFSKKNLPNRLFSHSRVNLSRTCKFDPAELISKYKLNVDGILHIGAHKGEEIESYLAAGVKNAAFVEPLEENFLILEKKVKLHSGYTAYKYAAGDEDKQIKIHLASNDLQSSSDDYG